LQIEPAGRTVRLGILGVREGRYALELALHDLAVDLRQFVANLQRPRLGDSAWVATARRRCAELAERMGELRERLAARQKHLPQTMAELRAGLQAYAAELGERCSRANLVALRADLARRYEDLLAQARAARLWRPEFSQRIRSLRLPSWARSLFHVGCGLGSVALYQFLLSRSAVLVVLVTLVAVFGGLEISRRFFPRFNDFMVDRLFGAISRPQERYRINSASWYTLALLVIVLCTPLEAACAGCLVLGFGDPTASVVGCRYGRTKLVHDKSLQGSLAFVAVSFLAVGAYLLLAAPQLGLARTLGAAGCMAVVGAAVELYSEKLRLDDNFSVPVAAAFAGMLWL